MPTALDLAESLSEARQIIAKQSRALDVLANAVFNDNGDMTISPPSVNVEHCITAYFARKAAHEFLTRR